ncbi:hypothetical protein CVT91_04730 [Candidatus Atribacteria bacterium HGW-Atribacteria-1]|nr:MAG: hypothetical protein CVT91_04730 [Candidatus Atribacteria bacterium HGW-Atribacteria-1]
MITVIGTDPFSNNRGISAMCMATIDIVLKKNLQHKLNIINIQLENKSFTCLYNTKYKYSKKVEIIDVYNNKFMHIKGGPSVINVGRLCLSVMYNILKHIGIDITNILSNDRILKTYIQSKIIIQLNYGDGFTDIYGYFRSWIWTYTYLVPIFLNKQIIFFPQTIGPFYTPLTRFIAKFILNRTKTIMVREKTSLEYIKKIGINDKKVVLIPDMAMILEPISLEDTKKILKNEGVSDAKGLIGISLRDLLTPRCVDKKTFEKYCALMTKIIDYLIDNYNITIILVPHDGVSKNSIIKDAAITSEILKKIKSKNNVYWMHKREYAVEELKGIIGTCDLFIGAYMHANIGALSMCVPTIGLSYSYKFQGIFEMLGQEKYACNLKDLNYEDLRSKVEDAWNNREKIRKELEERMPEIKKQVMFAGELVKKVLDEQESK